MEEKESIKITLFGKLTITYRGECIELSHDMGKQLVTLLEMLIYYRHSPLSKHTIMDALWADSSNPANVMKFSIFRLRNYLKSIEALQDLQLIKTSKNGYMLNPDFHYIIDCEQFNENYTIIKNDGIHEDTIGAATALLDVYNGDIYQGESNNWAIQASTYYRSIYQEYVKKLCQYYEKNDEFEEVLPIAYKASTLHPDNEDAHFYYLRAITELGEYEKALHYYNSITKLLIDVYEMPVSERMRKLYHKIVENNSSHITIHDIKEQLIYAKELDHAFYCEYDVFEYIFHVALRREKRMKIPHFLIMMDLIDYENETQVMKIMNKLKISIASTLRSVDVFTRVNKKQFIILAACNNEEDAHIAAQRVMQTFYKKVDRNRIKVGYYIESLE